MPRTYDAIDYIEPVSDSMMEAFGNIANYNVVDGCEVTYSESAMTVTIAAGNVRHNGTTVPVAEQTDTLVADGSNPRFTWVTVDSTGTISLQAGTAASDPTVPEVGDNVELALVRIEAGQTIAARCTYKMDKRVFGPRLVTTTSGGSSAILSSDVSTTTSMQAVTGLSLSVSANTSYAWQALIVYTASASGDYYWQITGPTGSVLAMQEERFNLAATGEVHYATAGASTGGSANGFGTSTPGVIAVQGSALIGSTAGTLQFYHRSDNNGKTKAKSRLELL